MLTLTLMVGNVYAQPSSNFPPSQIVLVDGERHQAFNREGFTRLLRLDADLVYTLRLVEHQRIVISRLENANTSLLQAIEAAERSIETLQAERTRLHSRWTEENLRRHELENKPNLSAAFGWTFAALFAVIALTVGITVGITK